MHRPKKDLCNLFVHSKECCSTKVLDDVVFALDELLNCFFLPLFRAGSKNLLPEQADLPDETNAINRRIVQKVAIRAEHIAQESLKKFRNSGPSLPKGRPSTRGNPGEIKTSFEVLSEGRKSDSNKTITLMFSSVSQRLNVATQWGAALPRTIKYEEFEELYKAFHSASI